MLCREHPYHKQVGAKIKKMLGTTLGENPEMWDSVPHELLALDAQLRRVLVDEEGHALLGREDDGEFVLGFAQPTLLYAAHHRTAPGCGRLCPPMLLP